jgi:hypothetical protein
MTARDGRIKKVIIVKEHTLIIVTHKERYYTKSIRISNSSGTLLYSPVLETAGTTLLPSCLWVAFLG